jgi:drug/metabolite transporter (DMT)-like permease
VLATLVSFCVYRERVTWPQTIGILLIVVAVCLITLCRPTGHRFFIGPLGVGVTERSDDEIKGSLLLALVCATFSSIFFAVEALFIRYLDQKGIPGNVAGFSYLLFEGIIGTSCLIVYSCFGYGIF